MQVEEPGILVAFSPPSLLSNEALPGTRRLVLRLHSVRHRSAVKGQDERHNAAFFTPLRAPSRHSPKPTISPSRCVRGSSAFSIYNYFALGPYFLDKEHG